MISIVRILSGHREIYSIAHTLGTYIAKEINEAGQGHGLRGGRQDSWPETIGIAEHGRGYAI